MRTPKRTAVAVGLLALSCASGCAVLAIGGAGVAGYAYVNGKCEKSYPYSIAETWSAVREAVDSMGLPVLRAAADELSGRLESRTADGDKVTIALEPYGPSVTKVAIRVGVFGDEEASRLILARIDERLPVAEAPAQATAPKRNVQVGVEVSR